MGKNRRFSQKRGKSFKSFHGKRFVRKEKKLPDDPEVEKGLLREDHSQETVKMKINIPSSTPEGETDAYTFPPFYWVIGIGFLLIIFYLIFY